MNCYNHKDVPAVAKCTRCGKYLCKECAEKYRPILCDECVETLKRENAQQKKQKEKSEEEIFLLACAFSVIACMLHVRFFLWALKNGIDFSLFIFGIILTIINTILAGGIPYGWRRLNKINLNFVLIMPIVNWILVLLFKATCSSWVGIFDFFHAWYYDAIFTFR